MNVASLELCKELYELSGWNDLDAPSVYTVRKPRKFEYSQYTLGYLLRKLPPRIEWEGRYLNLELVVDTFGHESHLDFIWVAQYGSEPAADLAGHDESYNDAPANPANAACKLAIELFKKGVLK